MWKRLCFSWLLFARICRTYRITSWYVGDMHQTIFPLKAVMEYPYTHIRYGEPDVMQNGTAICNKTDKSMREAVIMAHRRNISLLWGPGDINLDHWLWCAEGHIFLNRYLATIGDAVAECDVDGIEVDYEFHNSPHAKIGIVTPTESTRYSIFLANLKTALGPNRTVSADVSIWGVAPGNYLFGFLSWIDARMLNNGAFDWINTMSYHWNVEGNMWSWKKDIFFLTKLWGIDPKRINLGIPYFSKVWQHNHLVSEPTWGSLSDRCHDLNPASNSCEGTALVGKDMNYNLGRIAAQAGLGGLFPWAANYDSRTQPLILWLVKGFEGVNR